MLRWQYNHLNETGMTMIASIRITETEQEYLLHIPASQRERAKEIEGRHWDRERKVWVYPRTNRMYRALMTEFGDDLQKIEITPPDLGADTKKPVDLESQNADLRQQLTSLANQNAELLKRIEELLSTKSDEDKILVFQSTIAEQKSRINNLETDLGVKQNEVKKIKDEYARLLEKSIQETKPSIGDSLNNSIKKLAISCAGNSRTFESALNEFDITTRFVSEFRKILTRQLQEKLNEKDKKITLSQLIGLAKDADILSPEEHDLAHTIRKHRNILEYENDDPDTHRTRIIYIVIACSLLWPHLGIVEQ